MITKNAHFCTVSFTVNVLLIVTLPSCSFGKLLNTPLCKRLSISQTSCTENVKVCVETNAA